MNYFKTTHYLGKKKRTYNGTFIEIGEANISLWRRGRKRTRERKGEEEEGKEEEEEGDMKKMEKGRRKRNRRGGEKGGGK